MARAVKWIGIGLLAIILMIVALGAWALGPGNFGRMALGIGISYDTEKPSLPVLKSPAILVFSKTNGFRHEDAIPAANAAIAKMARDKGWSVYATENAAVFNPEQLARFKAVVWSNVSGDVLTTEQRAAFKGWLEQGGGYVGLHGAGGDFSYDWAWYVDTLLGAQFIGHILDPQFQEARLVVEDKDHPAMRGLGNGWSHSEEWYSFDKSPRRTGAHILVTVDESTYSPKVKLPLASAKDIAMGKDHPIVWTRCIGQGRALYSALGHRAEAYAEPQHLALIAGAISWAAGLEGPGC